jgi:hypothetical protein
MNATSWAKLVGGLANAAICALCVWYIGDGKPVWLPTWLVWQGLVLGLLNIGISLAEPPPRPKLNISKLLEELEKLDKGAGK